MGKRGWMWVVKRWWGRVIEVIGEGYLGKRVMKRCEEERRRGRDPVGSTNPKGILWGLQIKWGQGLNIPAPIRRVKRPCCAILAFNARLLHVSGVKCPNVACFWRLTPGRCLFLALNASLVLVSGVKRQTDACFWRLNARLLSSRVCYFQCCFSFCFLFFSSFCDFTWSST